MKFLKIPHSQKGQSSIETAVMAILLVIFLSIFFATLYVVYASYWIEHVMYESLICYQERAKKEFCVGEAVGKLQATLVFNKSLTMEMESRGSFTRAKIQMKIDPLMLPEKTFSFTKVLRI